MRSPLRNPRLQLMLVTGLLTAGSFWAWWTTRYQERQAAIAALVSHEAKLRVDNQKLRRDLAALGLDRIETYLDAYDRQSTHVAQLIPPDSLRIPFLPIITQTAQQYGVRLDDIKPAPAGQDKGFITRGFHLTISGQYHDVGAFLTALLSLDRITQLRTPSLHAVLLQGTPRPGASAAAATGDYGVQVTVTLLVYSTPTAPPPDSTAGDTTASSNTATSSAGHPGAREVHA